MNKVTFDVLARSKAVGFDDTNRKILQQSAVAQKAAKDTKLLSTSLLSVGAAALPVAGVATGALIGLGAAAGVAVVGVLGINDAVKKGTPLGKQYQSAFKPVVTEFTRMKQIAATGMFAGINQGVKALKPLFPALNKEVGMFSRQMGAVVGHAGPGLVALLTRLNPLFVTIGEQLVHGSQGFEQWAKSSQSVGRFVAYVQTTLPQVEHTFSSLAVTVSHLALAAEPFGGTTLTAIRLFSSAINSIPIGVLQTVVPLLLGLKVGNTISAGLNNASASMAGFAQKTAAGGLEARATSRVVGGLGKAVGFLGPVGIAAGVALGGLSVVMGRSKQAAIEDAKRVNDLTQAIQNQTTATVVLAQLQASGAVKAGKELGVTQNTLVQAVLHHGSALAKTKTQIATASVQYKAMNDNLQHLSATQGMVNDPKGYQAAVDGRNKLYNSLTTLSKGLQQEQRDYEAAKVKAAEWARQQGSSVLAAQIANGSFEKIAKSLGMTGEAYINAKVAADQNIKSTQAQTAAMILENNAAGLLNQSLQQLGGNNLGVAQAQTSVASANRAAADSFKTNKAAIQGTSAAAVANQQALQAAASAALQHGQAVAQQTGSTAKATAAINADKAALEAQLSAQHRLTPAVLSYINTLFKIPPLRRTKVDLDDAAARRKAQQLASYIASFRPVMEAAVHITGAPSAGAGGHLAQRATGGAVAAGHRYMVNELGQELYVRNNAGAFLIPGGPQMWTAPGDGQIINAATVRRIRNKITSVAHSSLAKLPGAAKSAANAVANALPFGSPITRRLQAEDRQLEVLVSRRAAVAKRLKVANQRLADAQQQYSQEVATVRSAVVGSFDLVNAGQGTTTGGLLEALQAQVNQAGTFAAYLRQLKGKLSKDVLRQLAEAGPANMDTLAKLAAASPAQIKQFNALYSQLGKTGTAAGHTAADAMYAAGINAAKGLVRGLRSQEKALDRQMQRLAHVLVVSLRKALGIHSPATALVPLGRNTVLGYVKGIDATTAHVVAAATRMSGAAIPNLAPGSAVPSPERTQGGGDTYIINLPGMYDVEAAIPKIVQGLERHVGKGSKITIGRGVR